MNDYRRDPLTHTHTHKLFPQQSITKIKIHFLNFKLVYLDMSKYDREVLNIYSYFHLNHLNVLLF
jgi:hypothetical protein